MRCATLRAWFYLVTHLRASALLHYNLARIQTLCVTPAMEAGVSDDVWTLEEILALLD
jgi:hypothetical protein